jgi:hypothetical protein
MLALVIVVLPIVVESSQTQLYPRITVATLTGSGLLSYTTARDTI